MIDSIGDYSTEKKPCQYIVTTFFENTISCGFAIFRPEIDRWENPLFLPPFAGSPNARKKVTRTTTLKREKYFYKRPKKNIFKKFFCRPRRPTDRADSQFGY
ncbi:MAG: hypothetical protein IJ735_06035 [Clostridia bacterium]|nr:hypothetical protein [Clostridia bacterium]